MKLKKGKNILFNYIFADNSVRLSILQCRVKIVIMSFHHECKFSLLLLNKIIRNFGLFRAQTIMKGRLKGAQTGHNLLKKKADALAMRFRSILKKIIDVRLESNFVA
jgi:hypothetical protein